MYMKLTGRKPEEVLPRLKSTIPAWVVSILWRTMAYSITALYQYVSWSSRCNTARKKQGRCKYWYPCRVIKVSDLEAYWLYGGMLSLIYQTYTKQLNFYKHTLYYCRKHSGFVEHGLSPVSEWDYRNFAKAAI
jgi:hypothetical protein